MSVDVKVTINTKSIDKRLNNFRGKINASVKTQIYRGSMPFTPYLTGALQTSAYNSSVDSGNLLIYDIEYARYQYYAAGMAPADFPHRTRDPHPLASCLWVDKYLNQGGRQEVQTICDVAPQILRF